MAHHVRQLAGSELAASTCAVAELGEAYPVAVVAWLVLCGHVTPSRCEWVVR